MTFVVEASTHSFAPSRGSSREPCCIANVLNFLQSSPGPSLEEILFLGPSEERRN